MKTLDKEILESFKSLLLERLSVYKMVLFGSRAREESTQYSDMDILVVLDKINGEADMDYVSECAWKAGFKHGIVVVPIVYTREKWENSPESSSLLALAVEREGVPI